MELIVTLTGIGHEDGGDTWEPVWSLPLGAPSLEAGNQVESWTENLPSQAVQTSNAPNPG